MDENNKNKFNLVNIILDIILWGIVAVWVFICISDFIRVRNEEQPKFCIKNGTTDYDDGEVKWCVGLGYKVYDYKRDCFNALQYGPFWTKDQSILQSRCNND